MSADFETRNAGSAPSPTHGPGVAKHFALLLVSVVVSLAAAEILVRVFLPPATRIHVTDEADSQQRLAEENATPIEQQLLRKPSSGGRSLYVGTAAGRRLRANATSVIGSHRLGGRDVEIRTNSLGYRNPEIGEKQRPRALFLGDSVTFGDWLHEPETFVRLVEQRLAGTERPYETINAAVGAIGLETEVAILKETGLSTNPDTVVLCFYLNDASPSQGVRPIEVPGALGWSELVRHVFHLAALVRPEPEEEVRAFRRRAKLQQDAWESEIRQSYPGRQGNFLRDPEAMNDKIADHVDDWGALWSEAAWESMMPSFVELQRLSQVHGFELLFVAFPVRYQVEAKFVYDQPQQRLRQGRRVTRRSRARSPADAAKGVGWAIRRPLLRSLPSHRARQRAGRGRDRRVPARVRLTSIRRPSPGSS